MKNETIKYFVYLRKSSEADDRQALSLESQNTEVNNIIKREGLTVIDIISESHSAKKRGCRPEFEKMIARIENGEANGIILWSISRLSRNAGDTGTIIDLLDENLLLEVKTVSQVFTSNPNDKFLLNLLCSQAKLENDNKGVDVKSGMRTKAAMGWYPLPALLGYKNTPDRMKGKKIIEIDDERFSIVKKMFNMVLSQEYSSSKVWKIATYEWGLRRPNGRKLSHSAWFTMLKNPFYYGEFQYANTWYKGKHKPMITKSDFLKIQKILGIKRSSKPQKHSFPYTGLLHCEECGKIVTAEHKFKEQKNGIVRHYIYYHCIAQNKSFCSQGVTTEELIHEQILKQIQSVEIPQDFVKWAIDTIKETSSKNINIHQVATRSNEDLIKKCEHKLDKLLDMRINQEITESEFAIKKDQIVNEKSIAQQNLKKQKESGSNFFHELEKNLNLAAIAYKKISTTKNNDAIKGIVRQFCSNLTLKDKKVNASLNSSFENIKSASAFLIEKNLVVRTSENLLIKRKNAPSYDAFPVLLRSLEEVRTLL
jgi:DNA invertase Pin-like site-specific DNA recombinase